MLTATDFDGDTVTGAAAGSFVLTIEDDIPELKLEYAEGVRGMVYEDALPTGIAELPETMTTSVTLQLADLLDDVVLAPGADEPVKVEYSILQPEADHDSGLTSKGQAVTYQLGSAENTLVAVAEEGRTVFTFSVNEDSGEAIFNLLDQLDHQPNDVGGGDKEPLFIQDIGQFVQVRVTDFDGDTVTDTLDELIEIEVENDIPVATDGQASILANETFNSVTASLNYQAGADEEISDINLLLTNGAAVMSDKGQMTNDGQLLVWRDNGDGSWSAVNSTGVSSFTVKPDYDAVAKTYQGTYTVVIDDGLDGRGVTHTIDLGQSLKGGNTYEAVFGSGGTSTTVSNITTYVDGVFIWANAASDNAVAFTGIEADTATVNYSSSGVGVGTGSMVTGSGETDATRISEILSLKFFSTLTVNTSGTGADSVRVNSSASTPMALTGATLMIDHLGPTETMYYSLWSNGVRVSDTLQSSGVAGSPDSSADQFDDRVVITSDDLSGSHTSFDEIRFEAGGSLMDNKGYVESNFRIASVSLESYEDGYDQTIIIPYQVTDFDGDSTTAVVANAPTFSVTFDGDGILDASSADAGVAIAGGSGSETIIGSQYDDTIDGGGGYDTIIGGDGDDVLLGGTEGDRIDGGAGDDTISGGDGDDTISGGAGADQLNGGTGSDTLSYADDTTGVNVNLAANSVTGGEATGDTITGFENVTGGTGADTLTGNASNNVLSGNAGNDTIAGGAGNDTLFGGEGDDTLSGEAGDDVLVGGAGADTLNGGTGNDTLFAGEETDGDGQDTVTGGDGADLFVDVNNDDDAAGGDIAADFGTGADENLDTLVPPPEPTV